MKRRSYIAVWRQVLCVWCTEKSNAMTDQTIWTDWGKSSKICTYYSCVVYTKLCMIRSFLQSLYCMSGFCMSSLSLYFVYFCDFLLPSVASHFLSQIFPVTHTLTEVKKIVNLRTYKPLPNSSKYDEEGVDSLDFSCVARNLFSRLTAGSCGIEKDYKKRLVLVFQVESCMIDWLSFPSLRFSLFLKKISLRFSIVKPAAVTLFRSPPSSSCFLLSFWFLQ